MVARSVDDIASALAGLSVVDLGRGMAPALVAKLLAELGCKVSRFEPAAGDPFDDIYPAYRVWHGRAKVEQVNAADAPPVLEALASADICIVGGEDFPGSSWAIVPATVARQFPNLVVLVIEAAPPASNPLPAVELLAQARSGLVFEQHSDRPAALAFAPASYCAALHGLTAVLAALCQRARGGGGRVVATSLLEGALTLGVQYSIQASNPVGHFNFAIPKDPWPLIFRCRDGRHIHFVLGSVGSKGAVYRILGIDDPSVRPEDSGMPNPRAGLKNFFGDIDLLAEHVARIDSDDLFAQLSNAGVAANYVMAPGECWDDPQVVHLGTITHDAAGRHVGLPMRGRFAMASAEELSLPFDADALPLAGVRILDFGLFVAGPFAGVALADLGADVIKIETPQGDPNRMVYRSYATVNRGKRALTIDLKSDDGRAIARRLIDSAQVVLNNFRPGVSARLGVDPATLHERDPDKIVLEATGFGRSGPRGDQPGFDMIFQALCGHEVRAGGIGGVPVWDRTAMVDYLMGLIDQVAVLVGLWRRFSGKGGADLDVTLLDAGLFLTSELVEGPGGERVGTPPLNASRTGFHPAEALYQCADGWLAIAARGEAMAAALATALAFEAPPRAEWSAREQDAIAAALRGTSVADARARLEHFGVWVEPCCTAGDIVISELAHRDPALELIGEDPLYGEIRQAGALFRLGGRRRTNPRCAPRAGEHTHELLVELGYDESQIADFFARKIVA